MTDSLLSILLVLNSFIQKRLTTKSSELRVLAVGEDFVILACVILTQCRRVTDRQTNGRIDGQDRRASRL